MNILDSTNTRLRIFTKQVEIDNNLPKWQIISDSKTSTENTFENNFENNINTVTIESYLNFNSEEFNVYLSKRVFNQIQNNYNSIFLGEETVSDSISKKSQSQPKFLRTVTKLYRKWFDSDDVEDEEEVYEFDVFKFFDNVKMLSKENANTYIERIKPYCIALKQASDMGQKALAEKLTAEIYNNKFESILYANGYYYKITEEQLVDFVKKTEKDVQLSYVKNFIRPIPKEVIEKKLEVDKLLVFDNYCILYYDPEEKSFKQTEAEREAIRKKKADPILFGMIHGSTNLYYITDWIDEYCDLTLEEFLKVSGIEKQDISLTEKINLL